MKISTILAPGSGTERVSMFPVITKLGNMTSQISNNSWGHKCAMQTYNPHVYQPKDNHNGRELTSTYHNSDYHNMNDVTPL